MTLEKRIADMISPALEDMGFGVVRIRLSGSQRVTLQIMADRLDETPITVEDCADISRAVSAILDVEDPIDRAYALEVSSPGIDRPLTRPRDFERFAGFEVKIELDQIMDGRRRFRGILGGIDGNAVSIETDTAEFQIPFEAIRDAKLVLTDALIEASRAAADGQEGTAEGSAV
ncbi:MAG: ribosome maturation factor RimP [Alphaproteobacteria bacterium]|jgi:ribosome maturation factor RimP|uniref:ribosome maturation factor RimP n=1 Tax=Pacificispira sp. TaxID=2888761 RepID=UPI001B0F126F|nr:ribosome maturation factor RimP [Alphaproteobacteria bacterium]MBO6861129.1 ribosome maturation factor RimP [Alphaproteobacteria bacterium]